MKPKERVLASLNHEQPDRVPIDLGGHRSSGIHALAYARLKKALGLDPEPVYIYDMFQQLAVVEEPVLELLGGDTIELGRAYLRDENDWQDWEAPYGLNCKIPGYVNLERDGRQWRMVNSSGDPVAVMKDGALFFELAPPPFQDLAFPPEDLSFLDHAFSRDKWNGLQTPGGHLPLDKEGLSELARGAERLRAETERAILGLFGGSVFEAPQTLFGMENYFAALALHPDACYEIGEKICKMHEKFLEKWLAAVGPFIDVVVFVDDLGGQRGPLISPRMYRELIKPFHARLWKRAKELAKVKVLLHSCGAIEPLLPDIIDAGADAVNPVQISCPGMEPRKLKEKYGERIAFWGGGCDTGYVLPRASPEQVARHVKENCAALAVGGGFVFQQVHNLLPEVPPQNIIAMFNAAREYRP